MNVNVINEHDRRGKWVRRRSTRLENRPPNFPSLFSSPPRHGSSHNRTEALRTRRNRTVEKPSDSGQRRRRHEVVRRRVVKLTMYWNGCVQWNTNHKVNVVIKPSSRRRDAKKVEVGNNLTSYESRSGREASTGARRDWQ